MKYRLASLSNDREQFLMRLCRSCNERDGQAASISYFLNSTSFRLDSVSPVFSSNWPYICPSCALRETNYSFLTNRPDGESCGVIVPTLNPAVGAGTTALEATRGNTIICEMTLGPVVFTLESDGSTINSFSAVGKPWASCCSNSSCPGCSCRMKNKNGGVIIRVRGSRQSRDELLCRYCSSDIVNFYRNMFVVSRGVLGVANWL